MQNVTPLEVPTHLLKTTIIKNKDILDKKYEYDKVGTNLNVIAEPAMAKFSGFEINKLNVLKIRIINKTTHPHRIYVLPPKSEYFNVKFDKKGAIPSGMAEELYVHFKPTEYKYYYDTIRINTQDDTLLIPLHGYPALSRDYLRELFPRLIDFGTLDIGELQTHRYPIQCKIPLNFEYEFTIIKDHPDIKINPTKGIVPGKGVAEIEVTYLPTVNVTVVLEAELKIAQFDFEPLSIKIMGSGKSADGKGKSIRRPQSTTKLKSIVHTNTNKAKEFTSSQENVDENSMPDQNPQIIYETEGVQPPVQEQFKTLIKSVGSKPFTIKSKPIDKDIIDFKSTGNALQGRQSLERAYLDHFNQVSQLDKDKEIRFFECIGDIPIKQETINSIMQERQYYLQQKLNEMQNKGITRYALQLDQDSAIVDQVLPRYECEWDFDKNDTIKIKKIKLRKFVYAVTRVIYRIRFDNRLQKIRAFLKGAKSRQEVEKMVNQDWQKAEYAGVGKKDFIQFAFEFEENCIGKFTLPVQYEDSNAFSAFKFDINPRTGFDDWAPIEQIPNCDQEVMQYKNWDTPQLTFHPPLLQSLVFRDGAEEEKAIRGKMGPPLSVLSTSDESLEHIRQLMVKQPDTESYALLQPHKTLKLYHQYEDMNPTSPFYGLGFSKVQGIGADVDPDIALSQQTLKQEFINRTPGFNNLNLMYELNLEQYYYKERNMQLAYDFGFDEQVELYCPQLLADKEPDDHLTDDDSDGEEPPNLNVMDVGDFLKKIEQDDKNMAQYRESIVDIQGDLQSNINSNLQLEKNKWIATTPSRTSDYNKYASNNVNKLVIL